LGGDGELGILVHGLAADGGAAIAVGDDLVVIAKGKSVGVFVADAAVVDDHCVGGFLEIGRLDRGLDLV